MEMGPIIRRAWDLTLKYKSLWIFAMFAEGVGSFRSVWQEGSDKGTGLFSHITGNQLILLGMIAGFIGLAFLVMSLISSVALVDAVNKLTRGGKYTWGSSFSVGIDYFWRYLGMFLLLIATVIVLLLVLALPAIPIFLLSTTLGVVLTILILVPVLLVGMFIIATVFSLAVRAMIVRNVSIGDAVEEGWLLLKLQRRACIKIFLVYVLLTILIVMAALTIIGMIAAPFILMAVASGTGLVMALAVGLPLVLLVVLILDGISGTFTSSLYTLFYFELLEPAKAQYSDFAGQPAT